MQKSQVSFRWQIHPLGLAIGVLLFVCALMVTQKYLRFGGTPAYDLIRSFVYNLVTIVPFILCVATGLIVRRVTSSWTWRWRALAIATLGFSLVAAYAITISAILYGLGMSTSWPSDAFLAKYTSGPLHVHVALFALIQFVPMPAHAPPQARQVTKAPPEIFGIPVHDVLEIEADDHYVWFHTRSGSVLKRVTMRDLTARLPDQFLRVHRSHIVNLNKVGGFKRTGRTVKLLVGDRLVPVSALRRALVAERLRPRAHSD